MQITGCYSLDISCNYCARSGHYARAARACEVRCSFVSVSPGLRRSVGSYQPLREDLDRA